MSSKQKPPVPLIEVIASLKKPSLSGIAPKPYVFVEGPDDVRIYREITAKLGLSTSFPSFQAIGGRSRVFQLHLKIEGETEQIKVPVIFFADRDTSVLAPHFTEFEDIAAQYPQINFTKGYSIENDLFEDGLGKMMPKLREDEPERFDSLIKSVCQYFAFAMELCRLGQEADSKTDISMFSNDVIEPRSGNLSARFLARQSYAPASEEMNDLILGRYTLLLRGKYLFQLLKRIMQERTSSALVRNVEGSYLWDECINEGLSPTVESSNCKRIASVFQGTIS